MFRINRLMGSVLTAVVSATAAAQTYSVTPLPAPGGPAQAFKATEQGPVVGVAAGEAGQRAFVWNNSTMTLIEPLRGDAHSMAVGTDAAGRVYGVSFNLGATRTRAFQWSPSGIVSLGNFEPVAVARSGRVVGKRQVLDSTGMLVETACMLRAGSLFNLQTLGGTTAAAMGINRYLRVVGRADLVGDDVFHACVWWDASARPRDLGTLGGATSIAYAISDSRIVVGSSETAASDVHALRVQLTGHGGVSSRTDLGVLLAPPGHPTWSEAFGVNNAGVIVGSSNDRAFVWRGGHMTDLNSLIPPTSGWTLKVARSVDSSGRIAGWGIDPAGQPAAFLLVPVIARGGIAMAAGATTRCGADFNASGGVTSRDLFDFMDAYFSGDPRADVDQSGTIGIEDIFDFVTAYLSGC